MGGQKGLDQQRDAVVQKQVYYNTRSLAKDKDRCNQIYLSDDENFVSFNKQLASMGLMLREIRADGNCLFRALGDQLEGHTRSHMIHRQQVAQYINKHREDFEPFVEDDVPFDSHVTNLAQAGTHAGNDAIVAFARLHGVVIVIHQLNSPLWQIKGTDQKGCREIHISYHNGEHFSSVRKLGDYSQTPANIRLSMLGRESNKDFRDSWEGMSSTLDCNYERQDGPLDYVELNSAEVEREIVEATGCEDLKFIHQVLEDKSNDIGATIDYIMNCPLITHKQSIHEAGLQKLWGPDGTGTRIFGNGSTSELRSNQLQKQPVRSVKGTGARPKAQQSKLPQQERQGHFSCRQKKEMKRQERKKNSEEMKRQKNAQLGDNREVESEVETILVKDIKFLNI